MSQFQISGFAVVTGGAGGIGREVGLAFAEAGAKGVLFCDIKADGATAAAEESKKLAAHPSYTAIASEIDVTNADSVQKVVDLAVEKFGRIDYCINAHGYGLASFIPFAEVPLDVYQHTLDINAKGIFLVSKAVMQVMQKQEPLVHDLGRRGKRDVGRGSIVNIGSGNSHVISPAKMPYVVSKHAVLGLTRCCAEDGKPFNIRVNQIAPSWVRTPMFAVENEVAPGTLELIEKVMPTKRIIEPDEVASAAVYLCTPSAAYINGISLQMDAGVTLGPVVLGG